MCELKVLHMKIKTPGKKDSLAKIVGANIKGHRLTCGLTQHDLAQTLGIEVETMSRYERGHIAPPIEQIGRIATILGVVPATLFVSDQEDVRSQGLVLAEQMRRLSEEDVKTITKIVKTYVDAHSRK